ncbi:MAG: XdhC family protein [Acidobacteria bacterium]|nr:XdhC family protein [Acidobacteriota bacterium]
MGIDIFAEIVELRKKGERAALVTIISRRGSTPRRDSAKMLVFEDGRTAGTIGGGCVEAEVCTEARTVIRDERGKVLSFSLTDDDAEESGLICGGTMEVYVEPILPDPTLFIFGAGHIGYSLSEVAKNLDFKIAVVDDRVKYASSERFPSAESIYVGPWNEVLPKLPINDNSFLVIATRGHKYDLTCLRHAVRSPARYIGLLGSRRKTKLFFETLEKEGIERSLLDRVHAPVGLEIGSETPEEIAVSIAAELIAVRKRLDVRPLKESLRALNQ